MLKGGSVELRGLPIVLFLEATAGQSLTMYANSVEINVQGTSGKESAAHCAIAAAVDGYTIRGRKSQRQDVSYSVQLPTRKYWPTQR